jgi:MFS family permease
VILALVCAAQFMLLLDLVVVNVALPTMQKDLRLSPSDLQWVVIIYGLTFGGFLLLGGRAADLLGRRSVLVAGLTMFTAGSLAAGLAGSLIPLLVARAVQGLGAAMAAPAALSILTGTFAEGPARNKALGIFGGVAGSAACLGLVVSGAIVGGPGWRWIFLINVPIGIALAGCVLTCVPKGERVHRGSADVLGAVTVTTGMLGIVYAINKSAGYGWTSPITLGVLAGGAAMLGLFVIVEHRVTAPLIPLSTFRLKTLTTANIVAGLVMGSFFGIGFQSTLFLQQVLGYSPLRTGAAGVITAVSAIIVASAIAARVVGRLGAARTLVIGQGIAIAGPPGRTCAPPPPSRHPRARPSATGSTPAETARPTTPCGGSCSPAWAPTRPPAPTSNAAQQRVNPRPRSSAASSATSPARSTPTSAPPADARYPGTA